MKSQIWVLLLSSLLLTCLIPVVESQSVQTETESVSYYVSDNSNVYNPTNVRDGSIGVMNQAQLEATSCDSECTSDSYAGLYLEIELKSTDTIVNVSVTYESWAEDAGLGETVPNGYQMTVFIYHKFNNDGFLIEETTTGYDNLRTVFIGSFAKPANNTLIIDYFLLHSDTNNLHDQVSARIHEIFIEEGPSDSDNDGVPDTSDGCNTPSEGVPDVDSSGCTGGSQGTDSDNDGINDENDDCANTPESETVNEDGCSSSQLDSDNDGINNDNDNCANTPESETVNEDGCSSSQLDSDNDGISDKNDECPNTVADANVNFDGCSNDQIDSDNDGINDNDDACPDTAEGAEVNLLGCSEAQLESDDDDDGIPNINDDCPGTGAGITVDITGCEIVYTDSDGDGYFDETNDAFPDDGSQWNDSDGDGYGDNLSGLNPDACLMQYGESIKDRFGCPDTDKDGYSNENDDFEQNPTQWSDLDGDGYGDNITGTNADNFPDDSTQWANTDGDEYGDNTDGTQPDSCIGTAGTSYKDRFGCPDEDNDGISNDNDQCMSSQTSDGLIDNHGCTANQKDSDGDGISDSDDECPDTVSGVKVLNTGCVSSTSGEEEEVASGIAGTLQNNLTAIIGATATAVVSLVTYLIFRRRSAKSVEYLKLAKIASDLTEIQTIRNAIETDLAKGRIDPTVHSRIDSILDERHKVVVERMNNTVQNEFN